MRLKFLQLGAISKAIQITLPILICVAIVGEILPEDEAKIIVIPVLIIILLLSVVGALKVLSNNRNES